MTGILLLNRNFKWDDFQPVLYHYSVGSMQMNNGNHLDDFRVTDCTCSFLYAHINVHRVQLDQECRE